MSAIGCTIPVELIQGASMMKHEPLSGRPIIFGEVLFDRFPDGCDRLGGAPFNVAWHLHGFGLNPLFLSRVGNDVLGREILARMKQWGMDTRGVQIDSVRPTGEVRVEFDKGEPCYQVLSDRAWDAIELEPMAEILSKTSASLVYHGTLAARAEKSARTLSQLIDMAGVPVFVDVNLRTPWWDRTSTELCLRRARWVKMNRAELDLLIPGGTPERCMTDFTGLEALLLTDGKNGSTMHTKGEAATCSAPTLERPLVDTVGAGDAFSAAAILAIHRGWNARTLLSAASEFAGKICTVSGALLSERGAYDELVNRWGLR
jgi:fructokinase